MAETLINGYHVVPICSREQGETVEYSMLENDLGEGYYDGVLFGASTGTRRFSLSFQNIANWASARIYTLDGVDYTPVEYLLELHRRDKVGGKPFAVKSAVSGQYYLCRFIEPSLTTEKAITALFSAQAIFRQVRETGVTVFDPIIYPISLISANWTTPITGATDNSAIPGGEWADARASYALEASTGVTYQTNEQNGRAIVRLDNAGGADTLTDNTLGAEFGEMFLVMKIRAASFTGTEAILGDGTDEILEGAGAGLTRFANQNFTNYEYRLNGTLLAQSAQTAPLNAFGIVHVRRLTPWTWGSGWRITGNVDIGEIILCQGAIAPSLAAEITEYLGVKWGISV